MAGHFLGIRALAATAAVLSDSRQLIHELGGLLRYFDLEAGNSGAPADTTFFAQAGQGRLFRDGKRILQTHSYPYLLASLEFAISRQAVQQTREHLFFHAGAVASGQAGILLPGRNGAGKTTLVAFLLKNGYEYLTDDMAAVELATSRMVPFPRPLNFKQGTVELLEPLGPWLEIGAYGGSPSSYPARYALPAAHLVARTPKEIGAVVFPRYCPGRPGRLCSMTRGEAALELLGHLLWLSGPQVHGFHLAASIARAAPAYRLEFDRLDNALESIGSLC